MILADHDKNRYCDPLALSQHRVIFRCCSCLNAYLEFAHILLGVATWVQGVPATGVEKCKSHGECTVGSRLLTGFRSVEECCSSAAYPGPQWSSNNPLTHSPTWSLSHPLTETMHGLDQSFRDVAMLCHHVSGILAWYGNIMSPWIQIRNWNWIQILIQFQLKIQNLIGIQICIRIWIRIQIQNQFRIQIKIRNQIQTEVQIITGIQIWIWTLDLCPDPNPDQIQIHVIICEEHLILLNCLQSKFVKVFLKCIVRFPTFGTHIQIFVHKIICNLHMVYTSPQRLARPLLTHLISALHPLQQEELTITSACWTSDPRSTHWFSRLFSTDSMTRIQ